MASNSYDASYGGNLSGVNCRSNTNSNTNSNNSNNSNNNSNNSNNNSNNTNTNSNNNSSSSSSNNNNNNVKNAKNIKNVKHITNITNIESQNDEKHDWIAPALSLGFFTKVFDTLSKIFDLFDDAGDGLSKYPAFGLKWAQIIDAALSPYVIETNDESEEWLNILKKERIVKLNDAAQHFDCKASELRDAINKEFIECGDIVIMNGKNGEDYIIACKVNIGLVLVCIIWTYILYFAMEKCQLQDVMECFELFLKVKKDSISNIIDSSTLFVRFKNFVTTNNHEQVQVHHKINEQLTNGSVRFELGCNDKMRRLGYMTNQFDKIRVELSDRNFDKVTFFILGASVSETKKLYEGLYDSRQWVRLDIWESRRNRIILDKLQKNEINVLIIDNEHESEFMFEFGMYLKDDFSLREMSVFHYDLSKDKDIMRQRLSLGQHCINYIIIPIEEKRENGHFINVFELYNQVIATKAGKPNIDKLKVYLLETANLIFKNNELYQESKELETNGNFNFDESHLLGVAQSELLKENVDGVIKHCNTFIQVYGYSYFCKVCKNNYTNVFKMFEIFIKHRDNVKLPDNVEDDDIEIEGASQV